jgi:alpha,alpha-trehalase
LKIAAVPALLIYLLLLFTAGIATTLYPTGQQWDYPNGWPPLQHMLITDSNTALY